MRWFQGCGAGWEGWTRGDGKRQLSAQRGHLISGHGSPVYPVLRVYHNTFQRREPVFRDYFLFGLGAVSLRNTERDVFNNLFVQADRIPGAGE